MRFGEFTENWIKKRFYEIADFYKGCGISKEQLTLEGNECILYGELYTTYDTETIEEIKSKTNMESKGLFFSKKNDVIIPASGETPIDIATACCVCKDNVLLGGDLNVIRLKYNNGSFISCQLNGKRKIDIAKIAQGASIVHLHNDDLMKLVLYIPTTLEEQLKIVKLFTLIDNRIKTQSKIIEDLKLLEKSIYNHIFMRLNKYEKIILEDIIVDYNKKTTTDNEYPILSSTLSGLYLQEKYFKKQTASTSTEGYKIVPYGYATYRSMSDTGQFRFNLQNFIEYGIVSPAYPVFTCYKNQRLDFILLCLNYYEDIKKQLFIMKQGGTRFALHFNSLCKLKIPKVDKEEQTKIMNFVTSLNNKIILEEKILKKYKEQKKYLLSNMFI